MRRALWAALSRSTLLLALLPWLVHRTCSQTRPTLLAGQEVAQQHSAIGVQLTPNQTSSSGVRVVYVFPSGPAGQAGLQPGDVILRIDRKEIDPKSFGPSIESRAPGSQITVEYQRGKSTNLAVITTEERSAMYKRMASSEPAPPSSVIGTLSANDAQKVILAALSDERGHDVADVNLTSYSLTYKRVWGDKPNQQVSVVLPFVSHAYLQTPKHFFQEGWVVNFISTPYYVAWNDRDEAARFATAINRLIWENSPQVYAEKILEHDALEQQVVGWRAAGSKVDPPEEAQRHFAIAQAAFQEKNFQHQAEELSAALEIYPTWPAEQYDVAVLLGELNRYSEAVEHMQMYLELAPDAPDAQKAKRQIWIWQDKMKTIGK